MEQYTQFDIPVHEIPLPLLPLKEPRTPSYSVKTLDMLVPEIPVTLSQLIEPRTPPYSIETLESLVISME